MYGPPSYYAMAAGSLADRGMVIEMMGSGFSTIHHNPPPKIRSEFPETWLYESFDSTG